MKKITYSIISVLLISFALTSCVKDKNYETPQISCEEPELTGSSEDIQEILDAWTASGEATLAFADDYSDYFVGYVTSSDKTGNFYKEIYLQNDPTNPTAAVKLGVDMRSTFTKYKIGRKVYVYMKGLMIGRSHGEVVIAEIGDGNGVPIRENVLKRNILKSCEVAEIEPLEVASQADINESHLGMYVSIPNSQFDKEMLGKDFVDEFDSYDSHRKITNCEDGSVIKLETSTYASFKNAPLPEGQGSVEGIISRDYGDDFFVIRINDPETSFSFDGVRCDPDVLECDNPDVGGDVVVFNEDFSSYAVNTTSFPEWTNINVHGGSTLFKVKEYGGEKYVQTGAYSTGENPLEVWLVTPAINLDGTTDEALSFRTKTGYNNGRALSAYISTDFAGDVDTATWVLLDATIANGPSSGYGDFVDSGDIDISCLEGDVYVAFKYLGGDGDITTTFQIDDIKVTGN